MSPDPTHAGPGHHLYRQGASPFPVLSCASLFCFFFNLLSFQKWHKAIQSPGLHLSFVCPPLAPFISFSICSGRPSGWHPTMLLQVSAHSGLICSGKDSGRIKCPCGNSSWIVFIFYHLILMSQQYPPVRVSTGNSAIHQLKAWPWTSGKPPAPQKKSILSFSFFFQSQKESAHLETTDSDFWVNGEATFRW